MMPNNLSAKIDEVDINDVFDDILFSEEKIIENSYRQGFAQGSSEDSAEGYHLGYHRGAEVGSEIGFYQAFAEHYLADEQKQKVPEKCLKHLETLLQTSQDFPSDNSENTDLFQVLETIRGLHKKICVQMKIKTTFKKEGINF